MPIEYGFDTLRAGPNDTASAGVAAAIERAADELTASGLAQQAVKAGDVAPNFVLADQDGNTVSSGDLLARGPLAVTFYLGAWCHYCNFELRAIETVADEIRKRGASLLAISPQTASYSRKSKDDNKLSFPLLVDYGGEVAHAFGVRWSVPIYLRPIHKALGADLTLFNGERSWTLPMASRYIVASDGTVAYSEFDPGLQALAGVLRMLRPPDLTSRH